MPEIAEAHIMADDLSIIEGHSIVKYEYYSDKYSHIDIEGHIITSICAIGKRVIFSLNKGYLLSTLSMTGKWIIPSIWEGPEELLNSIMQYVQFKLIMSNNIEVYFSDVRTWGKLEYLESIDNEIDKLGPDILNGELELSYWLEITANSRRKVCDFLTEQTIIAGIGNYLRAEILYHSRVNPTRIVKDLSMKKKERLYKSIHKIANLAYDNGGLSIANNTSNYISPRGIGGTYAAKVYNKKECPKGHEVSKIKGSQTIHYCNVCQK